MTLIVLFCRMSSGLKLELYVFLHTKQLYVPTHMYMRKYIFNLYLLYYNHKSQQAACLQSMLYTVKWKRCDKNNIIVIFDMRVC